jgi:hypothetical protein
MAVVRDQKLRRAVVVVFALGAVGVIVWTLVRPSGFGILASIFLTVQAGLLAWMARLQDKLRK